MADKIRPAKGPTASVKEALKGAETKASEYEYRGITTERDIEGEGDALGLKRGGVVAKIKAKNEAEPRKRYARSGDLRLPASGVKRATVDGRTSFHFRHESVSKTRAQSEGESGLVNRPGAAKAHAGYVEREGAVARTDAAEQAVESASPDAQKAGSTDVAGMALPGSVGSEQALYIERPEALAIDARDGALVFSNISDDPAERTTVWNLIEEFERTPGEDSITLRVADNVAFWTNVRSARDCPEDLAKALEGADAELPLRIKTVRGKAIMMWLRKRPGWDDKKPLATPRYGEGGRVQFRIVGELPHELPLPEMARIVSEFGQEFAKRNLPYTAVVHAPDHNNDARNWHFHLVYYDRPIAKMDDGRWDFTVSVERTNKWGNKWKGYPYRQPKCAECNDRAWVKTLRDRFAETVNEAMIRAGNERRYDPRKYEAMGIHRAPNEHLGTRAAALEARGIATPRGYQNAINDWSFASRQLERGDAAARRKIDTTAEGWERAVSRANLSENERRAVATDITRWRQIEDERATYVHGARVLRMHRARLESRAKRALATAERDFGLIASGKAPRVLARRETLIVKAMNEAIAHLRDIERVFAPEAELIADWEARSGILRSESARLGDGISQALKTSAPQERPVSRAEVDGLRKLIDGIHDGHRRLVRIDGVLRPRDASAEELRLLSGAAYAGAEKRLEALEAAQQRDIAQAVRYIERNAWAVVDGNTSAGLAYHLKTAATHEQARFERWADEPEIASALAAAAASRVEERAVGEAHRALDDLARKAYRIEIAGGLLRPVGADETTARSIAASIANTRVQARLKSLSKLREDSIARLSGYARANPEAFVDERDAVVLKGGPADLVRLAGVWDADPELKAIVASVRDATLAKPQRRDDGGRPAEVAKPALIDSTVAVRAPVESDRTASTKLPTGGDDARDLKSKETREEKPKTVRLPAQEEMIRKRDERARQAARAAYGDAPIPPAGPDEGRPRGLHPRLDAYFDAVDAGKAAAVIDKLAAAAMQDAIGQDVTRTLPASARREITEAQGRYNKRRRVARGPEWSLNRGE